MRTRFTPEQLADPDLAACEKILRTCVHCGFCNAACPTFALTGDELDGPRGRIYLIKDMLESGRRAGERTTRHLDRCLSCLSCASSCPSGVDYMHLVDHARAHVERTARRPLADRLVRRALALVLPHPRRFRALLRLASLARPLAPLLPVRLRAMLALAPAERPPAADGRPPPAASAGGRRVALLAGCVQQVLEPGVDEATARLLARRGCEVAAVGGTGCCGALAHHLGRADEARAAARRNVRAWIREIDGAGLDAIVVNASGCGTMVKDYGILLRGDADAARVAALARDVSELADEIGLGPAGRAAPLKVAYHDACSLRHGQKIAAPPRRLLAAAGFDLREPAEPHLCCGSAGTYNMLQPAFSARLLERKARCLAAAGADVVAAGNIGCIMQLRTALDTPVVHTVELLDWATGGPAPRAIECPGAA